MGPSALTLTRPVRAAKKETDGLDLHQPTHERSASEGLKSLIDAGAIAKWKVPTGMTCQVHEFETANPALRGEMTITITLSDADSGTNVLAVHDGLPPGLSASDNEAGWRMALDKLADLVEAGSASD